MLIIVIGERLFGIAALESIDCGDTKADKHIVPMVWASEQGYLLIDLRYLFVMATMNMYLPGRGILYPWYLLYHVHLLDTCSAHSLRSISMEQPCTRRPAIGRADGPALKSVPN